MYADAHLHLDTFGEHVGEVLGRAQAAGVEALLAVGVNASTSRAVIALVQRFPQVAAGVGLHPWQITEPVPEAVFAELEALAKENPPVRAIGEIGLDYQPRVPVEHRPHQIPALRQQIALARSLMLPMSIHCREAHEDLLRVLREEKAGEIGGCIHGYSGEARYAQELAAMGFYLSAGRSLLAEDAAPLREVFRQLSLERLMLETDAVYRPETPEVEPALVVHVAERLSATLGVPLEEVARVTTANFRQVFGRRGG